MYCVIYVHVLSVLSIMMSCIVKMCVCVCVCVCEREREREREREGGGVGKEWWRSR